MRITSYVFHTIQCKPLQTALSLFFSFLSLIFLNASDIISFIIFEIDVYATAAAFLA